LVSEATDSAKASTEKSNKEAGAEPSDSSSSRPGRLAGSADTPGARPAGAGTLLGRVAAGKDSRASVDWSVTPKGMPAMPPAEPPMKPKPPIGCAVVAAAAGLALAVCLAVATCLPARSARSPSGGAAGAGRPLGVAPGPQEPWEGPPASRVPWDREGPPASWVPWDRAPPGAGTVRTLPPATVRTQAWSTAAPVEAEPPVISARGLLESPELHEVAAENVMRVGQKVLTLSDRDVVHAIAVAGFRNISSRLKERAPEALKVLDDVWFTDVQRNAVLKTMRLLSDPRVQSIGLDVAKAIRESRSRDHWVIVDRIHRRLTPRVGEIRVLRDQLIPASLRALARVGHHWDLTLTPANIRTMADVSDDWGSELGASQTPEMQPGGIFPVFRKLGAAALGEAVKAVATRPKEVAPPADSKAQGISAGVSEQGRYLLDLLRLSVGALREDGRVHDAPVGAGAVATALGAGAGTEEALRGVSCSSGLSAATALLCPLKFGTQGLDALRAVVEIRVLRR